MKLRFAIFCSAILLAGISNSQTQGISYTAVGKGVATTFVTDYHSLGINASSLGFGTGFEGKKTTFGMTEFNFGVYSDSLNVGKLKQLYSAVRQDISGKVEDPARWEQQREYAQEYLNSGIAMDFTYNWLGFSYQGEKFGGIAFNVSESYNWYSKFNETTTDLVFNGKYSNYFDSLTVVFGTDTSVIANSTTLSEDTLSNAILGSVAVPLRISEITNGSAVKFAWNRYYNFGYGRKVFGDSMFAVYGGIGGRFIQSMALFDLESSDDGFYIYSSFNPNYDIDYGAISNLNPSNYKDAGIIPKSVGNGYGVDLSATIMLFKKLKIAAAVNNIGSVTYTRNVYRVEDSLVSDISLNGMENFNVTNSIYSFLEDGGILSLVGEEKYKVKNAANYRLGASIELGNIARFGMDIVGPFDVDNPGSLVNPIISFGGDVRLFKRIRLSAGYLGGGVYKHNVPLGINFELKGGAYEFGISSRDALSFFVDGSNSISTAFGFARIRI
ncbi:MAG: DUF5723 family protein [Crocinitomicaceae bacterium]|nr:DUF5723 family protein [Crocinitomicaceae bacterium]